MKKIFLFFVFVILTQLHAQEIQSNKHFANYTSFSTSLSTPGDLTVTIEGGKWGMDVPLTVGASLDYVRNIHTGDESYWFGIKPYYTLNTQGKYAFFIWFAPKIDLSNTNNYLIETGVGIQKQIKETPWYLWYMLGTQTGKDYSYVPSASIGINYVF